MKFFATAAALVGAASAMQYSNVTYTTEVVTAYTTYCPAAGAYTLPNGKVSTVTEATTLTVTDCPCTISKPVSKMMPKPSMTAAPSAPAPVVAPAPKNYTTTVLTTDYFTTYCPQPTTVVQKNVTYTVHSATTLTISNCPCTLTTTVPVTTTTIYTDKFTTYCPQPTTTVFGSQTFTITKPTTLTVSNCPTTMVSVVPVMPTTMAKPSSMSMMSSSASSPAKPTYVANPFVPSAAVNGSSKTSSSATSTGYAPVQYTGAAAARVGAGVGAVAVAGLAFFL
ncbi:hypothetical protein MBLNU457_5649t1 [Dothideomycetes sp. NU457]